MRALVVAVMAGLALSVGGPASGGSAAPTAIVDRTWSCPLRTSDGFRLVTIWGIDAVAGYEHDASMRVEDGLAASPAAQLVSVTSTEVRVNRRCAAARA